MPTMKSYFVGMGPFNNCEKEYQHIVTSTHLKCIIKYVVFL